MSRFPATIRDEETGVLIAIDPVTGLPGPCSMFLVALKKAEIEKRRRLRWWFIFGLTLAAAVALGVIAYAVCHG